MEKKVQVCEMHNPNGTFADIADLYKWLGKISTASAGHRFDIKVEITEWKEENL